MAAMKGIAGLMGLVGAVAFLALVPSGAIAHPACATAASSFLSLNAEAGWAGALPTREELLEAGCTLAEVDAALSQNVVTTAAADPVEDGVSTFT